MLFADLKAAFDNVDRKILWEELRRGQVEENLIKRMEEIYGQTEVVIRTSQGYTKGFRTRKDVRQGCVISSLLFNLYMARIEEFLRKRGIEGMGIEGMRIWSLAYADDIILIANNREAMQDMMESFKKFLKEKKLEVLRSLSY